MSSLQRRVEQDGSKSRQGSMHECSSVFLFVCMRVLGACVHACMCVCVCACVCGAYVSRMCQIFATAPPDATWFSSTTPSAPSQTCDELHPDARAESPRMPSAHPTLQQYAPAPALCRAWGTRMPVHPAATRVPAARGMRTRHRSAHCARREVRLW
jgi:hypothetical protein